jgi:hypothetical protein
VRRTKIFNKIVRFRQQQSFENNQKYVFTVTGNKLFRPKNIMKGKCGLIDANRNKTLKYFLLDN